MLGYEPKRNRTAWLSLLVATLVACGLACAAPAEHDTTFVPATPGVLRVATSLPSPGFWNGASPATISGGYECAIAVALAQRWRLRLEILDVPFGRIVAGDLGGADLALAQIAVTPERSGTLALSVPYLPANMGVLAPAGASIPDLASARAQRWVVEDGTTELGFLQRIVRPAHEPIVVPSRDQTLGPHALGVVTADDTIIPSLGQLGLLYLMFIAGAELDLDVIQRHRRSVAGFSVLTFGVPMTLGVGVGVLFGYGTAASLLIGSLWASHTLLTYPTVRNAGLAAQPAVASTVGATVVTDTLALTVLAGVAGAATGAQGGPDLAAQIVLGLIVLGGWCIVVLPRLGRLFYARIGHQPTIRYTFVLSALLSAAVLAKVVGIEGIVGAFFAGLGLNHLLPTQGRVFERVEFLGAALFIPLFLISVGLIIDPSVMAEPATLGLGAAFIGASLGGKGVAALACRPLFGYIWPEVGVTFGLTSASAAATLAATFVGFQVGVIGTTLVNAVLIVILVSVLVSSLATTFFVQRVPRPTSQSSKPGRSILLVVSSLDSASPALDFAARLAAADDGVVLPRVAALGPGSLDEQHLADLERLIARRGLDAEAVVRHDRSLADLALHAAHDEHATAIVVAESISALHDGDAIQDLRAQCPVPLFLIATPRPFRRLRCVGHEPYDANGLVEHLQRAGLEVAGSAQRPAALGHLLQRPQPPRPPDGTLVIMGPHDPWQVPDDTLLVAVVTTAS